MSNWKHCDIDGCDWKHEGGFSSPGIKSIMYIEYQGDETELCPRHAKEVEKFIVTGCKFKTTKE